MRLLRAALLLFFLSPAAAWAGGATIRLAGPADRRLADDGRGRRTAALRPGRPALAGHRHGPVPDAQPRRPLERLAARRAGGRGSARPRHPRDPGRASAGASATRTGSVPPIASPGASAATCAGCGPGTSRARLERSPLRPSRWRARRRSSPRSRGTRTRRSCAAPPRYAGRRLLRGRPPHGGLEQLHGGAVAGDRPGDRAVPREGERLERHRLQLSRRQVRPGVRGPDRRHRAERDRCARGGVQHGLDRRRRDRQLRLDRRSRPRPSMRSCSCSPGGSTSPTSTRSRSSTGRRAATRSTRSAPT